MSSRDKNNIFIFSTLVESLQSGTFENRVYSSSSSASSSQGILAKARDVVKYSANYFKHGGGHSGETMTESVVAAWFQLLYALFIIPYGVVFDSRTGKYAVKNGSLFRKIMLAIVAGGLILDQLLQSVAAIVMADDGSILGTFVRVKTMIYFGFILAVDHAVALKGKETCELLTSLRVFAGNFGTSHLLQRTAKLRLISLVLLGLYMLKALHYAFLVTWDERHTTIIDGPQLYLTGLAREKTSEISAFLKSCGIDISMYIPEEGTGMVLLGLSVLLNRVMVALLWVMTFALMTLWAFLFWLLFSDVIESSFNMPCDPLRAELHKFNTLTTILDRFNRTYGWVTFSCVFSVAIHFSLEICSRSETNASPLNVHAKAANWLMMIIFTIHLAASARVNYTASGIVDTLKARYQTEECQLECFQRYEETAQGIALIFHEIQTNRVGIQGSAFFTVTYSFIGTVTSLICTYAVLVMQANSSSRGC